MNCGDFKASVDEILKKWEFNGCLSICKSNHIIFEGCNGWADYEHKRMHTIKSRFLIASVTKQFTAACIMMLVEEGKIHLDDPLQSYIPEYTYAAKVTIRQLLNMTSGIPDMISQVIAEEIAADIKLMSKKEAIIYENRELPV